MNDGNIMVNLPDEDVLLSKSDYAFFAARCGAVTASVVHPISGFTRYDIDVNIAGFEQLLEREEAKAPKPKEDSPSSSGFLPAQEEIHPPAQEPTIVAETAAIVREVTGVEDRFHIGDILHVLSQKGREEVASGGYYSADGNQSVKYQFIGNTALYSKGDILRMNRCLPALRTAVRGRYVKGRLKYPTNADHDGREDLVSKGFSLSPG